MPKLSAESTAILNKVIDMLGNPEYAKMYNQRTFMSNRVDVHGEVCGTECCLAGFIVLAAEPDFFKACATEVRKIHDEEGFSLPIDPVWEIQRKAASLMTEEDGEPAYIDNLFDTASYWPRQFADQYERVWDEIPDKTNDVYEQMRLGRARVAIKRLEYFRDHGR